MAEIIVETASGRVRGKEERGVSVFKCIPYAAPPLGENRFRPPRKVEPWNGVRDALAYGDQAIQDDNVFNLPADLRAIFPLSGIEKTSEDCLTLTVTTPGFPTVNRYVPSDTKYFSTGGATFWFTVTRFVPSASSTVTGTFVARLGLGE